jgi:signal transduction histidine kinase/ActR/RegA family two-component response regulator
MQVLNSMLPPQYLHAALVVSLLSMWMLVALFYYLNRYTKRDYFTIWTAAWLFYALWLTLGLEEQGVDPSSPFFPLRQSCLAVSAVFLLWGSARFVGLEVRQTLFGLFMLYLLVWIFVAPQVLSDPLQMQLPVFVVIGSSSAFAGVCFHRLRRRMPYVGAGLLSLGFWLWGVYLATYPLCRDHVELASAGFFVAAVLQLFLAVSMVVLVLEEVRDRAEQMRAAIAEVRSEKEALQAKMLTAEEECRTLYDQVRLSEGVQRAYEELRRTQQVVVQQERLRAVGQLASGLVHDINNALSPIVAYSELLLKTTSGLTENGRRHLQIINRSGEDIAHMLRRLRDCYRPRAEAETLMPVNVNQEIEEVIELTRPRWRDLSQREGISIQIETELQAELPLLRSDSIELREGLINLVFNAVDALPEGGTVTLATRLESRPASDESQTPKPQVVIEVRDNGIGMDEETRRRCLEPFFSTKLQRGGTGLGLAMVYGMMQRSEGQIEIESAPGMGTCIRLLFPIPVDAVLADPAAAGPRLAQNRSLRILCIDDEPQVRLLLRDCLTNLGHRVTTAPSGEQGVEMFCAALESDQAYETVITDLGMPGIDGHQVARSIKAASPDTPIVMLTGWEGAMKENGDRAPEVAALVGKPARASELNSLLLQLTAPRQDPVLSPQFSLAGEISPN